MKFVLLLSLALFSSGSFANEKDKMKDWSKEMDKKIDSMSFEDSKKMMMDKMDKKEEHTAEMKTCINNAMDKAALKKCHKSTY